MWEIFDYRDGRPLCICPSKRSAHFRWWLARHVLKMRYLDYDLAGNDW